MTIKILHVVGNKFGIGATQTWLIQVLRHIDRSHFKLDFVVHTNDSGYYDQEVISYGSDIFHCLNKRQPWLYRKNFLNILQNYGPYDIVHSHVADYSAFVLKVSKEAGVPIRIAHSHTNPVSPSYKKNVYRWLRFILMRNWFKKYATHYIAVSKPALSMFGIGKSVKKNVYLLSCTPELKFFRDEINPSKIRESLGIPPESMIIGHVGRFIHAKNHDFILDIAKEILARVPQSYFLLIGDGILRGRVEKKAIDMGLTDKVIFLGFREDIPVLLGAMDIFLFPSRYEGLPMALVEAQAAGLPCVYSEAIPQEAEIVPPLLHRLSLNLSAKHWAEKLIDIIRSPININKKECLEMVAKRFDIKENVKKLEKIYNDALMKE